MYVHEGSSFSKLWQLNEYSYMGGSFETNFRNEAYHTPVISLAIVSSTWTAWLTLTLQLFFFSEIQQMHKAVWPE